MTATNQTELRFTSPTFGKRIRGMLGVDFYRLFHTPLFYIFLAIAAIIPAMVKMNSGMEARLRISPSFFISSSSRKGTYPWGCSRTGRSASEVYLPL